MYTMYTVDAIILCATFVHFQTTLPLVEVGKVPPVHHLPHLVYRSPLIVNHANQTYSNSP